MKKWIVFMVIAAVTMAYLASENMLPYTNFGNSERDIVISSMWAGMIGIVMVEMIRRIFNNTRRLKREKF